MSFNRGCESRSGLEHITKHSCVNTDSPAQQSCYKAVVIATCSRGYHEGKSFWSLLEYRQTITGEVGHSTAVRESEPVQSSPFNPNRHLTGLSLQEGILPFVCMYGWVGGMVGSGSTTPLQSFGDHLCHLLWFVVFLISWKRVALNRALLAICRLQPLKVPFKTLQILTDLLKPTCNLTVNVGLFQLVIKAAARKRTGFVHEGCDTTRISFFMSVNKKLI